MSINQRASLVFRPEELNELIFWIYNIIDRAYREKADSIRVSLDKISWYYQDAELGVFPIKDPHIALKLRSIFDLVIQRDSFVKSLLEKISEKDDMTVYQVKISNFLE